MLTSWPGSRYGSGCSSTPSTTLNIDVVAPIPTASVSIIVSAKAGRRLRLLAANDRSCATPVNSPLAMMFPAAFDLQTARHGEGLGKARAADPSSLSLLVMAECVGHGARIS